MINFRCLRFAAASLVLTVLAPLPGYAAQGSWVASAPGVRVAVPERETRSSPLAAGVSLASDARIERVRWRFDAPSMQPVGVWLCHPSRCIPLSQSFGESAALAGLPASVPLHFVFRLPRGGRAVQINGLQVITDYR
ncbi:flagellar protein FlhE [Litchfieldella xinjiangensis]|uniref:flagellar protein FlhE n=1 Tax=Litchfieldella xinjiangensis TaxID=1166948 RepID=UPI0009DE4567|nr:flagellar protein FlhE [Halomonas xinjiangensis]